MDMTVPLITTLFAACVCGWAAYLYNTIESQHARDRERWVNMVMDRDAQIQKLEDEIVDLNRTIAQRELIINRYEEKLTA